MLRKRSQLTLFVLMLVGSLSGAAAQDRGLDAHDAVQRGNQQYARANYELAIAEYRRVPASAGEIYAKALYNIGVCHYELWKTEEAVAYYRKAIEASNGRYPGALHALGVALIDLGRRSEAKTAFEQALVTSAGNYAPAHYLLGQLALDQADHEGAVSSLRNAIDSSRDRFPAAHNNLGVALARLNRLPEAKREFEIALSQADGELVEARQNLKLCNSLMARSGTTVAALKAVEDRRAQLK